LEHPLLKADFNQFAEKQIEWFEQQTSCEIRIHLESKNNADLMDRAAFVFDHLGMRRTKLRNAILIYIQIQPSQIAVIGDAGLSFIATDQWKEWVDILTTQFKTGAFENGVKECLGAIAKTVQSEFPYQADDVNELTNQISL
jgi:uncharacterized membrane protein